MSTATSFSQGFMVIIDRILAYSWQLKQFVILLEDMYINHVNKIHTVKKSM